MVLAIREIIGSTITSQVITVRNWFSTVPIEGFQSLRGRWYCVQLFQIGRSSDESSHLPIFKTCLNMILIPEYRCYEEMVDKFMFALTEGLEPLHYINVKLQRFII